MVKARVTSKGQVTLPAELRRQLGVEAGDDLDFVMEDRGACVSVAKRKKLSDLHGVLPLPAGKAVTKKAIRAGHEHRRLLPHRQARGPRAVGGTPPRAG